MTNERFVFSTGLPGLDTVLQNLLPGDNIVWQIDTIEDYTVFVDPFCAKANAMGKKLVYFRFADHPPLLSTDDYTVEIIPLHPAVGLETFINEIFNVIERIGKGACYVFDCLSELAVDWSSDRMLGNFFLLTCPYLFEFETVTYFALLRNRHSFHAVTGIHDTAQIILDIYRNRENLYVHPLKVFNRHSDTMYQLHLWKGDIFQPVTSSATISEILAGIPQPWLDFTIHRLGEWNRKFAHAAEVLSAMQKGTVSEEEVTACRRQLIRLIVSRDRKIFDLAESHLHLADLLEIRKRMIGTGLIGGKSVGMLLARAILREKGTHWKEVLEAHDSFFIGSDVFYTFLVQNGCWWIRRKQKNIDALIESSEEARRLMLSGRFPDYILEQFEEMLNYFGQVPIIVRSSSLLEDNYGNSFSGKYESVFCANQGTPQERLEAFINAVRGIYASTMSKDVLMYRAQRGLLDLDEQMALLVQRVSGDQYNNLFFPQVAGVGYSFNPYVWSKEIDPSAGMLRLVFGLGTRAVERKDDDYARIVALNVPKKRPEATFHEVRKFAQQKVDVLNLQKNTAESVSFEEVVSSAFHQSLEMFASRDEEAERFAREKGMTGVFSWVITFEALFTDTPFIQDIRAMLQNLHEAYAYPVDIEFTTNFLNEDSYRINLLQCRPFQVKKEEEMIIEPPQDVNETDIIFKTAGQILGNSVAMPLDWIIYVLPSEYSSMSQNDRYAIAHCIGRLTHCEKTSSAKIMLLGPGRWGTTTPSLGVPVSFSEINTVSVLCEIAAMHEGLIPEISLGTHFFNDIVEMDMLYLGISPQREGIILNEEHLINTPNLLEELLPGEGRWAHAVRVIQTVDPDSSQKIHLYVDALKHEALCYIHRK